MLMDGKSNEQHNLKLASMTDSPLAHFHEQINFISLKFSSFLNTCPSTPIGQ
ncbi:hypothetical protein TRIATDRAFT_307492 [Trichoderma atroviride IMI 206040]|uniref:Uncharacterized protein n=1 Tax=Hypocrea atroviridis (strain ATCC 20476 / IMI 206040) TaxID=452589 RepID=G9NRS0_HYPAI|nr:uncharacterized protein TRIATDRAFT_307492 [Trichoderma atroviride IMI 206040]EHK46702.1 hypothetical protein TRIATDRAFT_307492 [Trichoderma atroviride IMI 206040]